MWICDPDFLNRKPVQTLHKQFGEKVEVDENLKDRHMLVRCAFEAKAGEKLSLDISADDYYKLYVNGKFVGVGPAQAYTDRYPYNTYDISEYLTEGKNVIAAHVFYMGTITRAYQSGDERMGLWFELKDASGNLRAESGAVASEGKTLCLDNVYRKYIEPIGATSIIFKIGGKIVIPALTGNSLPSVTRKSCIEILRDWGYLVAERRVSIDEIVTAIKENTLEEMWGCGEETLFPIGSLTVGEEEYTINLGNTGAVTKELYDLLTGIQWGTTEDTFTWSYKVC